MLKQNFKNIIYYNRKETSAVLVIIALFIAAAYISALYAENLKNLVYLQGTLGMAAYILITIVAVVAAPISTFPILPVAVVLWGSFLAALASIIGWSIGAAVAFLLARKYGYHLVARMANIKKIERMIPQHNIFLSVVLLRIILPVDILSYALGLLTSISFKHYMLATIIGITPFAFIFSYAANIHIVYQAIIGFIVLIIIAFGYFKVKNKQDAL